MSKGNPEVYKQFGLLFGRSVHALQSAKVDPAHKTKSADLAIVTPATLHTIKSVEVNSIRKIQLAGGVEAIVINGGEKEITVGAGEKFINKVSDYKQSEGTTAWIGEYTIANELCRAANNSEISRLEAIRADIDGQIEALKGVNEANERALRVYNQD